MAPGRHHDLLEEPEGRPASSYVDSWIEQKRNKHYQAHGQVGELRPWPALSRFEHGSVFYLKEFELRAVAAHIELWVPTSDDVSVGVDYPAGDCRNGDWTTITDEQIAFLVDEFETKIYPQTTSLFGKPANRNGRDFGLMAYEPWMSPTLYQGPGQRVVVLVDNFRSPNFFDADATIRGPAGSVSTFQQELVNRNVLNIRGTGWAWMLGGEVLPTHVSGDGCLEARAIPNFIQGLLGHEYTHVLQSGVDGPKSPGMLGRDPSWIVEGLAMWTQDVLGYDDPTSFDPANNYDILCFLGHLSIRAVEDPFHCFGGAENSLTQWGEGHQLQTDYGAAYAFFEYLEGRFGPDAVTMFHCAEECGYGRPKAESILARFNVDLAHVVLDWSAAMAVDGLLSEVPGPEDPETDVLRASQLNATIEWDSPFANGGPGVRPWASDYVVLRNSDGTRASVGDLEELSFRGSARSEAAWSIAAHGHGFRNPALFSGPPANDDDRAIIRAVVIPMEAPILEFDVRYDLEPGFDFAFVQVSADHGQTWRSLSTGSTTTTHDPTADPDIVANLPGFTGWSAGWRREQVELPEFAGQEILLRLRIMTDKFSPSPGIWVDNIVAGGTLISDGSTLDLWHHDVPAFRFVLRIISQSPDLSTIAIATIPLDEENDAFLPRQALAEVVVPDASFVAAIVTFLPDAGQLPIRYELRANGVLQPGG